MLTRTFLALVVGLSLSAQGPGPGFRPGPGRGPAPRFLQQLDLSEAQKGQVKALADKHQEAMKPKAEAARQAHETLRKAMMDSTTPVEQLKKLHDAVSQARFELALGRRAHHQELLALLTPDQKTKAEKLRGEMDKRRAEGPRGPHRGRGPGRPCPAETK